MYTGETEPDLRQIVQAGKAADVTNDVRIL